MNREKKTILVVGATGNQGGAVTCHLLMKGWHVRAFVRDPLKAAAQVLAQSGVEVVKGDLDNVAELDAALKGVYGVFSVQTPIGHGPAGEIAQGKALADAARGAGVQHFIYSSIGGADRNTGIPQFESKWEIEQHIRMSGLPATILRPVFFMDNFNLMFGAAIPQGTFAWGLRPGTRLQMIASADIGGIASLAFERPEEFIGKEMEIAGDELTMLETADVFSRVLGRPVQYVEMPLDQVRGYDADMLAMLRWFDMRGFRADIPAIRELYPELMRLESWLRFTHWDKKMHSKATVGSREQSRK